MSPRASLDGGEATGLGATGSADDVNTTGSRSVCGDSHEAPGVGAVNASALGPVRSQSTPARQLEPAALMTLEEAKTWARVGVLAALALVLSYIETFIPLPVPVPGVKLGLANVIVLVALVVLDVRSAALVAVVKVLAAGFLFGSPMMIAYSAAGTVLAFGTMALMVRVPGLSMLIVAIAGAILHNVGQLCVAMLVLGTPLVWASAPVLVLAACFTGALSGVATRYTLLCLEGER